MSKRKRRKSRPKDGYVLLPSVTHPQGREKAFEDAMKAMVRAMIENRMVVSSLVGGSNEGFLGDNTVRCSGWRSVNRRLELEGKRRLRGSPGEI